jgi:hypothetical protein
MERGDPLAGFVDALQPCLYALDERLLADDCDQVGLQVERALVFGGSSSRCACSSSASACTACASSPSSASSAESTRSST